MTNRKKTAKDAPESPREAEGGQSVPIWLDEVNDIPSSPLRGKAEADVCVVGAGIAGLSVAYRLAAEGRSVIVIDDGSPGGGETSRTTAHLTNMIDGGYRHVERMHGEHGARIMAESHTAAIQQIGATARAEKIDCDFRSVDGYLFVPPGDPQDPLEHELAAARRAGIDGVSMVDRAPLEGFETGRCLRFADQARFHPLRYLRGLANAIERDGGRIHSNAHVEGVETEGTPTVSLEGNRKIKAKDVVIASHSPVHTWVRIHDKQAAYRSFAIVAEAPPGAADVLLYDTLEPYHYVRFLCPERGDGDGLLIIGGEDHKTGQEDDAAERYRRLEAWARDRFPRLGPVVRRWSGQILEPVDGVAYIGRDNKDQHLYVATGFSGTGMTYGAIAGRLIADQILGRDNAWADLYDPGRVTLKATGGFLRENLNATAQYKDFLTPGEEHSVDDVPRGTGAILRDGLRKVAVYRDDKGAVHTFSAICPHLGCVVAWNSGERTWDCPCHGSRFSPQGEVLNGPAAKPLESVELHEHRKAAS
jgi:glycine/D-amino acid oxidase-like deaminating enzyme/nitrite reductase/ring-hydroxylating ferredoxin subunit